MGQDASTPSTLRRHVSTIALCFLAFLAGAFITRFETFPYPQLLERPLFAARAYLERASSNNTSAQMFQWQRAVHPETGVVRHRRGASEALTMYVSGGDQAAQLMTMEGEVVHRWKLPFSEVWPDPSHISEVVRPAALRWSSAHMFSDGSLLVNYKAEGTTPSGYGLAKIDHDSDLLWKFPARTHHDVHVGDDGTIYALTQQVRPRDEVPIASQFVETPYVLDDQIVRLTPDGEPRGRISVMEAIAASPYRRIATRWFDRRVAWDRLHTNAVEPIPEAFARHHTFADPGDLLISIRSLNAIGLVDFDAAELTWVTRGPWLAQHDPDPLPNGHLLVFDNQGHAGPDGTSRILEYDPGTDRVVWQYTGTPETPFETAWAGEQNPLSNGNVLINEALRGRIFEITRDGEIVWAFHNPQRMTVDGREYVGIIAHGVQRVRRSQLDFPFSAN